MRLLFDQNISFRITKRLKESYPDSKHVSDCGLQDCDDPDVWKYAKANDFSIVTFDADFYEISLISGHPPKIIWPRTGNLTTGQIAEILIRLHNEVLQFLNDKDSQATCLEIES